ncbi:DUF4269 domain-containing protein [Bacillus carboniphilus]|uniref:DUF4269 domain-containing protein n=1 Tax=Bacillus carboniphilus TaxID=86663 RepID=A0ABY9JSK3_9BACI|nr:DUF4269 domain-containing protein [Bacillus carboniphilus]WLR42385.1 DUF4269 domain-containing protein [Bacillus carboniphilus]
MFQDLDYLLAGNERQKKAYQVISSLNIYDHLNEDSPVLCGTIPIGIDVEGSDLDIIVEVHDEARYEEKVRRLYGHLDGFTVKHKTIRKFPIVKVNFTYNHFEFELFAQAEPVKRQYAYLHMIIEHEILKKYPHMKSEIIQLKKQGYKTEPAFCYLLRIEGDPYEGLIEYGKEQGFI